MIAHPPLTGHSPAARTPLAHRSPAPGFRAARALPGRRSGTKGVRAPRGRSRHLLRHLGSAGGTADGADTDPHHLPRRPDLRQGRPNLRQGRRRPLPQARLVMAPKTRQNRVVHTAQPAAINPIGLKG